MSFLLANYHTHTKRCQHASGEDADYVETALQAGYQVLGFSDHSPWPFSSGYVSPIRMSAERLDDYIASVHDLQKMYDGRIRIHLGLEAEYFPRYHDWLERMRDRGISYFILGQHYADSEETRLTRAMNASRRTVCGGTPSPRSAPSGPACLPTLRIRTSLCGTGRTNSLMRCAVRHLT